MWYLYYQLYLHLSVVNLKSWVTLYILMVRLTHLCQQYDFQFHSQTWEYFKCVKVSKFKMSKAFKSYPFISDNFFLIIVEHMCMHHKWYSSLLFRNMIKLMFRNMIGHVTRHHLKHFCSQSGPLVPEKIWNYKWIISFFFFFRWGHHLYMSLFPSVCSSVCPSLCCAPYPRNHTSSNHNFWCKCKMMRSPAVFLIFQNFDFLG